MTKILLVEDNEMNKDMLSRRLMKKGYDVVFVACSPSFTGSPMSIRITSGVSLWAISIAS